MREVEVQDAAEHQPEVHRADKQLGRDIDVSVRPEVAPCNPSFDHSRDLSSTRLDDGRPERVAEGWVGGDLGEQRSDDRSEVRSP